MDLNNYAYPDKLNAVWIVEAIACKSYLHGTSDGAAREWTQGWTFRATTNMNNYKCYKLHYVGDWHSEYRVFDFTFDYKRIHELDYMYT